MIRNLLSTFWQDVKTYIKIYGVYPSRYPSSRIYSYINNESILGAELSIGKNTFISDVVKQVGSYTYIGNNVMLNNCERVGTFCSISHNVKVGLDNHDLNCIGTNPVFYLPGRKWIRNSSFRFEKPVVINDDVLISANAMIMSGVEVGVGSVIGAGSFVNKNVPPYAIVAGVPAKVIRYRFDNDTIKRLLNSKWWEKGKQELIKYQDCFSDVNVFLDKYEKMNQ